MKGAIKMKNKKCGVMTFTTTETAKIITALRLRNVIFETKKSERITVTGVIIIMIFMFLFRIVTVIKLRGCQKGQKCPSMTNL